MKVFITWSGDQTRDLGLAVKEFLETAFAGHVETFLSDSDVAPGERFLSSINSELDAADLGLLLVTRANQHAPWLLFEAGASAGKTARGSVIPVLIDIERAELDAPLNQFQNVIDTSRDSFSRLWDRVRRISGTLPATPPFGFAERGMAHSKPLFEPQSQPGLKRTTRTATRMRR